MKTMDFNTKNGRNLNDLGYPYFSKPHQILYPPVTQHRHGQIQLLQARKNDRHIGFYLWMFG